MSCCHLLHLIHSHTIVYLYSSAAVITDDFVEVRLSIGLPAAGRRVLGYEAVSMFCEDLPTVASTAMHASSLPMEEMNQFVNTIENADFLRGQLDPLGLVSFIPNNAILPRHSGIRSVEYSRVGVFIKFVWNNIL